MAIGSAISRRLTPGSARSRPSKLTDALASYRSSVAIMERIAKADPGNAGWQADLSRAYFALGRAQVALGDGSAALAAYQASLAIAKRLTGADATNASWQLL